MEIAVANPSKVVFVRLSREIVNLHNPAESDYVHLNRQPGDLGVLRGVIHGFSEEARTRGFASLALARFAFIGCDYRLCGSDRIASIRGST